jgi:hypothetical protein
LLIWLHSRILWNRGRMSSLSKLLNLLILGD